MMMNDDKSDLQYDDYFVIAIDSTGGIKVSNKEVCEWIRHRWNVKKEDI